MQAHLRANLWLLGLTLVICCVLYPLVLLGVAKLFPGAAEGSLVTKKLPSGQEQVVGSRLIGQPFDGDEYFHPRPSNAGSGYDASQSGATNWGASNPQLRERVAMLLGPIVKYGPRGTRPGELVGPDIETWLHGNPGVVAQWMKDHSDSPQRWLGADKSHADMVAKWKKDMGKSGDPDADDVVAFFADWAKKEPKDWAAEVKNEVQAIFFDAWRQAHRDVDLELVPADMVTASASGLDPHITLENARYQLQRVVDAWATRKKMAPAVVKKAIEELLLEQSHAPFGGAVGVPLVNVLEVNLALPEWLDGKKR